MGRGDLVIDGSFGEGGGQILRTAVSLAAALWWQRDDRPQALRIVNIRAGRPKPGLRAQHLVAVQAAAEVCGGTVEGAEVGSSALAFRPGRPRAGEYRFDIGTAGSSMLVLQTLLPALLLAEGDSEVTITGGTHNPMAPCAEYIRDVFGTLASGANAAFSVELIRMGFYPAGGGSVRCRTRGLSDARNLAGLRLLSRGDLKRIEGLSIISDRLPEHIARRQGQRVLDRLQAAGLGADVAQAVRPADSPGTCVFLRAVFSRSLAGFSALGQRGKPAERVADEAADGLLTFLEADGAVDPHAADQLITLLALAPEGSELTTTAVTPHLLTNAEVVRLLTGRNVEVTGQPGQPGGVVLG